MIENNNPSNLKKSTLLETKDSLQVRVSLLNTLMNLAGETCYRYHYLQR